MTVVQTSSSLQNDSRTLLDAIESYFLYCHVEGRSKRTLETNAYAIKSFSLFVGIHISIDDVTPALMRTWIKELRDRGYKPTTINIKLRSVKAFFNWLFREGMLESNPVGNVRLLKTPKKYPFHLSDKHLQALLEAIDRTTWTGQRNWAMVLTFLDAMLRLSELADLELSDVNLNNHSISVRHGKGDKERIVFMGSRLMEAMKDWIQVRGIEVGEYKVFISRGGSGIDLRNVQRTIQRLAQKAGLAGVRCSPHTLRHTGATLYIRNGGDPFSLQQLLGHSDIKTTEVYVHMAGTALKEAHAKASPVDKLLGS